MKIYYDNIVYYLQRVGGISVYWTELARILLTTDHGPVFIERADKSGNMFRDKLDLDAGSIIREPDLPLRLSRYLPVQVRITGPALFHSSYYRISGSPNVVNIVTVHDFIYERFARGLRRLVHMWQKRYAFKHADGIICISESTKRDLLQFYGGVDEKKVKVIYSGFGDAFVPLNRAEEQSCSFRHLLGKKYILYVGNRDAYKNFPVAVRTAGQFPDYLLVIVSNKPFSEEEEQELRKFLGNRFIFLSLVPDHELNILYNFAHCLLYPSSYEGFGIPLGEAMKAGCPVVTTRTSAIPEVVGDAGLMVEQMDEHAFAEEIRRLENPDIRTRAIETGLVQAGKFTWDRCFTETVRFYGEVYENKMLHS